MRGTSFPHRTILDTVQRLAEQRGATVDREHAVWLGASYGFIDLVLRWEHERIAVEAELSPKRIANDLRKADALTATRLHIVTPTSEMAWRCSGAVTRWQAFAPNLSVTVSTLGTACRLLSNILTPLDHPKLQVPKAYPFDLR